MKPIFVVADGRAGTTFLMRLLASHPEIVAYEDYPLEFRPALFSLYPNHPVVRGMLSGQVWHFDGDQELLHEPLKTDGSLPLEHVAKIYASIARASGKTPLYYAEKCPPGIDLGSEKRLPHIHCLLLVRDPRDVVLSIRAFNRKRGFFSFNEREGSSVEDLIVALHSGYEKLMAKSLSIKDAHLVRYEDLVTRQAPTLGSLYDWLGIDSTDNTIRNCALRAAAMEDGQHRTSASQETSVERWRREMPIEWQELFARHFDLILRHFNYPDATARS